MLTEQQDKKRHAILGFPYPAKMIGGTASFRGIDSLQVKMLIAEGFMDPEETQNNSPTAKELLELMEKHLGYYANGYMVDRERSDCRVTLEAIGVRAEQNLPPSTVFEFLELCKHADDLSTEEKHLYAWWD